MLDELTLVWKRFSPLEARLLAEVRNVLPAAARAPFDAQVGGVTRVQRSPPDWNEICLYRMRRGRVHWGDLALFPCTDEFRLAEVRFAAGGRRFRSTLSAIAGHIFDFATAPGPRQVAFAPWEAEPRAVLLADPLRAPTGTKQHETLPPAWERVLRAPPPSDAWQLHDGSTAYRLALADGEYLVLAEREGEEFLLHRIDPLAEGLSYLASHDGAPEPLVGDPAALIGRRR